MNTEIHGAQVNALKIANTLCNELVARNDLPRFFAQILGERKAGIQINRYEYLLDNIYPIVYQHLLVDAPLSEDTLIESAKIIGVQMNGIVARASEAVAQQLVRTKQWEELYATIQPIQGLQKTPWDTNNTDIVEDAVHFVTQLVYVNCSSPISPDNATKWLDHFAQKSFGLIRDTTENSNYVYGKSKKFATKLMRSDFLAQSHMLYAKQLFAQMAQQLEASRNLVARHSGWSNIIGVASPSSEEILEAGRSEQYSSSKMNQR